MPPSDRQLLYLCADRGLPLGGTKGGSVHMRQFLDHLPELGWSATVLVAAAEKDLSGLTAESIHTIPDIRSRQFINAAARVHGLGAQAKEAADFLRNEPLAETLEQLHHERPFELIYERYSLFSMAGRAFANKFGLPFVLEVNSPLVLEAARYRNLEQSDLACTIEKYLFTTADHIVAVSQSVKEYILGLATEARVTVIPNGFDPSRFPDRPDRIDRLVERTCLNIFASDDIVIGFLGAVKPWHGVEELLGLFKKFRADRQPLKLAIVGNNKHLADYWKKDPDGLIAAGTVVATGPVDFETVPRYLSEMDILVAPYPHLSDFYFSPLKVYEYMASGKPIIASAIGQIKDILTDNVSALLITPGDTGELRQAILKLKDDRSLRERLGRTARELAFEKHTWQNRLGQLDRIIQPLTKRDSKLRETDHAR